VKLTILLPDAFLCVSVVMAPPGISEPLLSGKACTKPGKTDKIVFLRGVEDG
jgi:hypothetical protein